MDGSSTLRAEGCSCRGRAVTRDGAAGRGGSRQLSQTASGVMLRKPERQRGRPKDLFDGTIGMGLSALVQEILRSAPDDTPSTSASPFPRFPTALPLLQASHLHAKSMLVTRIPG